MPKNNKSAEAVIAKIRSKRKGYRRVEGVVGYSADYSLHVHERTEIPHAPPTQAKFLEQPARERADELNDVLTDALKGGLDPKQAVAMACLQLQAWSQELCPVDTGNLRASAYTEVTTS